MLGPASHTPYAQPAGKNLPNLTRLIEELSAQAWTRLPSYSNKKWQRVSVKSLCSTAVGTYTAVYD